MLLNAVCFDSVKRTCSLESFAYKLEYVVAPYVFDSVKKKSYLLAVALMSIYSCISCLIVYACSL